MSQPDKNYCFRIGELAINRKTGESHIVQWVSPTTHSGDMLKFDVTSSQNYKAEEYMTAAEATEYYKKQIEILEDYLVDRKSSDYFKKLLREAEVKLQIARKREIALTNEMELLNEEIAYLKGVIG